MRITIIGPAPPLRGGISSHTAGLTRALALRGHRVDLVSYKRLYPAVFFPGRAQTISVDALGSAEIDTMRPATWRTLRRGLRRAPADLVVAQWWHPIVAPALRTILSGSRAPVVLVCHNVTPHEPFPAARILARMVMQRCQIVVCHSRAVAADAARIVGPRCSVTAVPMPVLVDPGDHGRVEPGRRGTAVLFVGHVRAYKGVDVLLDAWDRAQLPAEATLTIAGESYLGDGRLESMIARMRRRSAVELLDRYVDDSELWELVRSADVVVLPYRRASQSGLLPVALLAGARVISSDAGGLAEPITDRGRHRIVAAGDARQLARALEEALGDPRGGSGPPDAPWQGPLERQRAAEASWLPLVRECERAVDCRRPHAAGG